MKLASVKINQLSNISFLFEDCFSETHLPIYYSIWKEILESTSHSLVYLPHVFLLFLPIHFLRLFFFLFPLFFPFPRASTKAFWFNFITSGSIRYTRKLYILFNSKTDDLCFTVFSASPFSRLRSHLSETYNLMIYAWKHSYVFRSLRWKMLTLQNISPEKKAENPLQESSY